jgi:protein SCO1/2
MRRRALAGWAVGAALVLAAGCGGSGSDVADTRGAGHAGEAAATAAAGFEGGVVSPRRQAPPLRLRDIDGRTVDIRDFRGDPVLVTFVYANCPDVCPLIMENLRRVRAMAGPPGARMRVIAVSVDPTGDTAPVVRRFLAAHRVRGLVSYLVGTRPELEATWGDWQVATTVPRDDPELIEHSALIYGVTASGELATAYPVGFEAAAIARDLPLLAGS